MHPDALLAGILLLALALRLPALNSDLWYDEILTLTESIRLPLIDLVTTYRSPNNHVLYSLMAHAVVFVTGEAAWALRIPAVLLGVASIWALYRLVQRVAGRTEASLAALLLTVSYHHVWFSQNARGYTGLLFFAILATDRFHRNLTKPGASGWTDWGVYGCFLALAMYTHLTAGFVFAGHAATYAGLCLSRRLRGSTHPATGSLQRHGPLLGFGLGMVLTAVLYAPMLPDVLRTITTYNRPGNLSQPVETWSSPIWLLMETVRGLQIGASGIILGLGVLLVVLGVGRLLRSDPVLTFLALAGAPLTFLVLLLLGYHLWPRFFFVYSGFAVFFLVHGLHGIPHWITQRLPPSLHAASRMAPTVIGLLATVGLAATVGKAYALPKQDFTGARSYVEARRQPGDAVVTVGLATLPFRAYYAPTWEAAADREALEAIRQRVSRVWVITTFPTFLSESLPELEAVLNTGFTLDRVFPGTLAGGALYVYQSRARGD